MVYSPVCCTGPIRSKPVSLVSTTGFCMGSGASTLPESPGCTVSLEAGSSSPQPVTAWMPAVMMPETPSTITASRAMLSTRRCARRRWRLRT